MNFKTALKIITTKSFFMFFTVYQALMFDSRNHQMLHSQGTISDKVHRHFTNQTKKLLKVQINHTFTCLEHVYQTAKKKINKNKKAKQVSNYWK